MVSKLLSLGVFASCLFGYSYSMESVDKQIKDLGELCTKQCYYQLDCALRVYSQDKRNAYVFTKIRQWGKDTGDVCILYHTCRNDDVIATIAPYLDNPAVYNGQNALVRLLVRVYIDVAACKLVKEGLEFVYDDLFRTKVCGEWYPNIEARVTMGDEEDLDFGKLVKDAVTKLDNIKDNMPDPIWACFCTGSSLRPIGLYKYTVKFGDVDAEFVSACHAQADEMKKARLEALKRIGEKLQKIATIPSLSNKQKWEIFLNLKFSEI